MSQVLLIKLLSSFRKKCCVYIIRDFGKFIGEEEAKNINFDDLLGIMEEKDRNFSQLESNVSLAPPIGDENIQDELLLKWNREMIDFDPEVILSFELDPGQTEVILLFIVFCIDSF